MLSKMYGDAGLEVDEMEADRQAYEDAAEFNATRPMDLIGMPTYSKPLDDAIPF